MKESIIKVILNFSFILPGSSQFINKDWHKGVSLSLSAVVGLMMFIFGGEKASLLGFLIIMLTLVTNFIYIIDLAFKPIIQDLHEIAVSLERIADKLEIMAIQLKQIADALPEMKVRITILDEGRKLLSSRKEFPLLPPGKGEKDGKVILLPGAMEKKKEKLEEKSRVA